jgi:putative endonuclease
MFVRPHRSEVGAAACGEPGPRAVRYDSRSIVANVALVADRMTFAPIDMTWFVYILECRDGSLYTGIAVDVARRYALHAAGKGARYTRAHPPARLLASFAHPDRSSASKAEYVIKQLTPPAKRALCGAGAIDRS